MRKKILIDLQCLQTESANRGIGRYSYNLVMHMLKQGSDEFDFHVLLNSALPSANSVKQMFTKFINKQYFHVFTPVTPCYTIDPNNWHNMQASEFMYEAFVAKINPDLLFLPSFVDGGIHDSLVASISKYFTIKTVVVGYDLIPLHFEENYLSNHLVRRYYFNKLQHKSNADLILGISEFVTEDIKKYLDCNNCVNISTGRMKFFEEPSIQGLDSTYKDMRELKYLLYTGGTDFRKNISGLIEAYSLLPDSMKEKYTLLIVGSIPEIEVDALKKKLKDQKCFNYKIYTYVSDSELKQLYANAELFIFPSLDEGFGLPVLEAMQSGAVVCCGRNSSLVEVAGLEDMFFDASNPKNMSNKMRELLLNNNLRQKVLEHSRSQYKKFSWEITANRVLDLLKLSDSLEDHRGKINLNQLKPKLFVGVLSNITKVHNNIIRQLSKYFSVYLVCDDNTLSHDFYYHDSDFMSFVNLVDKTDDVKNFCLLYDDINSLQKVLTILGKINLIASFNTSEQVTPLELTRYFQSLGSVVNKFASDVHNGEFGYMYDIVTNLEQSLQISSYFQLSTPQILQIAPHLLINNNCNIDGTIYIDITSLCNLDHNTGIQRVEKIILHELIHKYTTHKIVPIYFKNNKCYSTNNYLLKSIGIFFDDNDIDSIINYFDDSAIFIAIDLHFELLFNHVYVDFLKNQQNRGARLFSIQYDLIPLHSNYSDEGMRQHFNNNMHAYASFFDGVIAISKAVADEYIEWHTDNMGSHTSKLSIGYFHLGCDIENYNSHHASDNVEDLSMLNNKKYMLMVSTIEPRKGHSQVLEAFERLWKNDSDYCLVLVGKQGWSVDELIAKINGHKQLNKKLFWLQGISDQALTKVYEMSSAFIMASFAEGFGLGIVESAKYHKPLILRDIPVFREIAEEHAYYFDCLTGKELAISLERWIALYESDSAPSSKNLKTITWEESCKQLMDVILHDKWYKILNND